VYNLLKVTWETEEQPNYDEEQIVRKYGLELTVTTAVGCINRFKFPVTTAVCYINLKSKIQNC
jgi:hypothetical protein